MKINIIIPAYNEAETIEKSLNSLLNQTKKASKIIVVNDGSTDNTAEILTQLAQNQPLIKVVNLSSEKKHLPGSKIIQAFNKGFVYLEEDAQVICKFDADLIFPENYLEKLEMQLLENQQVGMFGGVCYILKNDVWQEENLTNPDHLRGALKAYRRECFNQIGGLKTAMGWDTADELLAQFYGWKVKVDKSLIVKHLRPTGAGYHQNAHLLQGSVFYRLRYGFLLSLLACVKLALKKKKMRLIADYLKGYQNAKREKQPFLVTPEQGKWIRNHRWKSILRKIF